MNISQKCNCCIKESVCKYAKNYKNDCERIKQLIQSSPIEITIKCKEFAPQETRIRGLQNER